jgi:hypothetical protein
MKDSFVFYKSFMDAIDTIPQIKYRYFLLESIIKLGLFSEESEQKLISFCEEIEQKLSKNSQVLGLFFAIKPQLIANYRKYLNGCKGKSGGELGGQYGKLGGRPKKPPKNPPNENEECIMNNVNENVNENITPSKEEILDYTKNQLGKNIDIDSFIAYYEASQWKDKTGLPVNWKQKALYWANTYKPPETDPTDRSHIFKELEEEARKAGKI